MLIYQTALCSAMLEQLEERYAASGRLSIGFECRVESVDALSGVVGWSAAASEDEATSPEMSQGTFDLVAGCDGVRSVVRSEILKQCPGFEVETNTLPGSLKVSIKKGGLTALRTSPRG